MNFWKEKNTKAIFNAVLSKKNVMQMNDGANEFDKSILINLMEALETEIYHIPNGNELKNKSSALIREASEMLNEKLK